MATRIRDYLAGSLAVVVNEIEADASDAELQQYFDSGASVFLLDVTASNDACCTHVAQQIRNCCTTKPVAAIIAKITGRQSIIGELAHSKPELQLLESSRLIVTADRRFQKRGTRIAVYANCLEFLQIVRPGSVIRIGDNIQLSILEVVRDSFVCTVLTSGPIKPGDAVQFSLRLNEDAVTPDEQQDIALAQNCGATALLLPMAFSIDYIASLRMHLQQIGHAHMKLFASCSSIDLPTIDVACTIADALDGIVYTLSNRFCANIQENIEPTADERHFLQYCHMLKKPIFLRLRHTTDGGPTQLPGVVANALNYLHYYVDGFVVPATVTSDRRQSFADEMVKAHIEHAEIMNWKELNRQLMALPCEPSVSETLCLNAAIATYHLQAKAMFVISNTGRTAIKLSNYRPFCAIVAVSANERVAAKLLLYKHCKVATYSEPQDDKQHASNTYACERARMLLCGLNYALLRKIVQLSDTIVFVYRSAPILTYCDVFTSMRVSDFKSFWCNDVKGYGVDVAK